jgi:ATP-binding cassette subfamily C protein
MRKRAAAFGKDLTDNRQQQYRNISEFVGGMKVVKSLNVERVYFDRFRDTLERLRQDSMAYVSANSTASALFQIANGLGLAIFVYVALVGFQLSLAQVIVMLFVFWRVSPRFMELQTNVQQLLMELPAFGRMQAVRANFDAAREPELTADAASVPAPRREVALRDVSFSFQEGGQPILNRVSLSLPAGKVSALIGPSGAGKSTIADILLGLLEPSEGQLVVDGVPVEGAGRRIWRQRVAYVPQEIFLLHDSIAANLRLAAPDASDVELWLALEAAQASAFVAELDAGLQTVVGERGIRLSGGERQRIALARALLRKPSLLILDEATSALDWQNQALIAKSIESLRGSMTILTIAHRPSMIAFADWVIAMEQGRVVETGAYNSLRGDMRSRLSLMLSGEQTAA